MDSLLEVQKYLTSGKTLQDLKAELGVNSVVHPTLPLVILNYCQIDSPKTHPIVRECRGLTLDLRDFSLVSRSFPRFFNWGEVQDEMPLFDFSDFAVQTKEDGSLLVIYKYCDEWRVNTRGSFAQDPMQFQTFSWESAICQALGVPDRTGLNSLLREDVQYVGEFCSPWNKIVRRYEKPIVYLLTAFRGLQELSHEECDQLAQDAGCFVRPDRHNFCNIEEITEFLLTQSANDPTFEGVVIRDRGNRRWKIKNATYLALHRLKGEGNNLFNPKHLLPFILTGEKAELLVYFPEVEETLEIHEKRVHEAYEQLEEVWRTSQGIEVQKDFALTIKGKTKFTSLLFELRKKHGANIPQDALKSFWRESTDLIIKNLF